jgi:hypothetical protein
MANFTATQGRYLSFIHTYTTLHGFPPAESGDRDGLVRLAAIGQPDGEDA